MSNKKYFAAREPKELADALLTKINDWYNVTETNGYLEKLRACWAAYHGAYYTNLEEGHKITFGGEQGELAQIFINHIRNLAQHMLTMTISARPTMDARAINTDYKSLAQVTLANGLLDYYMREKRMERYIHDAVEQAIVMGSSYVIMEWDATAGKIVEDDEDEGSVYREGDVVFKVVMPTEVVFDTNKDDYNHDWYVVRTWKNRHDLLAKYPEYEDEILSLPTKSQTAYSNVNFFSRAESEEVAIYSFYHRPTESMPEGRQTVFLDDSEIVLLDMPLPYKRLPIYRIATSNIIGTSFAYSNLFDLLPIQEASNQMHSAILSNQMANSVQNIFVEQGSNLQVNELGGGLKVIEGTKRPEPLNLEGTSPNTFNYLSILQNLMELLSGISSATRGNPAENLRSGNSLAMMQAMSLQFISPLQQQYVQLVEDLGTGLIELLKQYATTPRVASIVGKNNRAYLKEFKSTNLSEINRVIVDVGNPLARSMAGRVEMAQQLLQMKSDKFTIAQYIQVMNTGRLEILTDDSVDQMNLIYDENEKLSEGQHVQALILDDHKLHIEYHKTILSNPNLRNSDDPEVLAIQTSTLNHINEHISMLENGKANLLMSIGQQPLQPEIPPKQGNQLGGTEQSEGAPANLMEQPQPANTSMMPNLPSVPKPPAPFENLPVTNQPIIPK